MQNQAADRWAAAQDAGKQLADRAIREGRIDRDEWFGDDDRDGVGEQVAQETERALREKGWALVDEGGDLIVKRWEVRDAEDDTGNDIPSEFLDIDNAFAAAQISEDAGEPADVWEVRPDGSERRIRA